MQIHAPISGVTSWNIQLMQTLRRNPSLGIHWRTATVDFDFRPDLEAVASEQPLPPELRDDWFLFPRWREGNRWGVVRKWVVEFPWLREVDVLLTDSWTIDFFMLGEALQRRYGKRPAVVNIIHTDADIHYEMAANGFLPRADAVWAVSRHIQSEYNRRYPHLPPAEHLRYLASVAPELPAKSLEGPLRLIWTGRIDHRQKRVLDLLPVLGELEKAQIDFQLEVVGDGPTMPELRARLGNHSRVRLWGPLPHGQVLAIVEMQHAFLSFSEFEGTSLSLLEAMGRGVVPIVTDIPSGVRDLIRAEQNGFLVPVGGALPMAAAIANLAHDRGRLRRMSQSAWERVKEEYGEVATATRVAELIRRAEGTDRRRIRAFHDRRFLSGLDRYWLPETIVAAIRRMRRAARD